LSGRLGVIASSVAIGLFCMSVFVIAERRVWDEQRALTERCEQEWDNPLAPAVFTSAGDCWEAVREWRVCPSGIPMDPKRQPRSGACRRTNAEVYDRWIRPPVLLVAIVAFAVAMAHAVGGLVGRTIDQRYDDEPEPEPGPLLDEGEQP
jgi:hypothetical protein